MLNSNFYLAQQDIYVMLSFWWVYTGVGWGGRLWAIQIIRKSVPE